MFDFCFSFFFFCCRKATTKSSFAPSPPAAHASASLSRVRGRQRLAFLAASATGGARKPNPSEGAEGAPAQSTEFAAVRSAAVRPDLPRCETQHYNPSVAPKARQLPLHRGAEGAPAQSTEFAKVRTAVTPAAGGRPSSVTVRAAPHRATFPKGKAMCSAQSTGFAAVRCAAVRPDLPRRVLHSF